MNCSEIIPEILLLALISSAAFIDAKKGAIPLLLPAAGLLGGVISNVIFKNLFWTEIILGSMVGGLLLLISLISSQAIGFGDGLILIATGSWLGLSSNLLLFVSGLILSALFAGVLLAFKRKGKMKLPFQPFLLGGYIFMLAIL